MSGGKFESTATRCLVLVICTIVSWLIFDLITDSVFLTPRNLSNLSVQISMTALVAVALTGLLVAREIDLSVGSLFALITVISVLLQVYLGFGPYTAVAVCLVLGSVIGLWQGAMSSFLRVPSFIVTLAGFSYLQGLAYLVTGNEIYAGTSPEFRAIANGTIPSAWVLPISLALLAAFLFYQWRRSDPPIRFDGKFSARDGVTLLRTVPLIGLALMAVWAYQSYRGIPIPILIVGLWALLFGFAARHTAFGRHVFAIGGNPEAARRAGINLQRVVLILFAVTGATAAMAGIIQAARLDSGPPNVGVFLALDGISAAVIGGASLFGGIGGVRGSLAGALLLGSIQNGLGLMGLSTNIQTIASGLILLTVVSIDAIVRRARSTDV